jgi:hypothetical protein
MPIFLSKMQYPSLPVGQNSQFPMSGIGQNAQDYARTHIPVGAASMNDISRTQQVVMVFISDSELLSVHNSSFGIQMFFFVETVFFLNSLYNHISFSQSRQSPQELMWKNKA